MKRSLRSVVWIRRAVEATVIIGVVAIAILNSEKPVVLGANAAFTDEGPMPELSGAVAWLNSAPLSRESLRGKVVLVNFWTYSCINSLRELPYIKSWAAKYKDAGLVVIRVHAPEFGFEKERANVENAVRGLKVTSRSRSTATTGFGKRSATNTGRQTISSMGRDGSAITTSARASTTSPSTSSRNFYGRLEPLV